MTTFKFNHPRCKHDMIKDFCDDCRVKGKRGKSVYRAFNPKRRKKNGQFDVSLQKKVGNAIAVGLGALLIAFSGFNYWLPVETVNAEFVTPESELMTPGADLIPTPTPDPIKDEIREVFGEYAEDAFLILQGTSDPKSCKENKKLDPEAINRNWHPEIEGVYTSSDFGVFQINDHWQGVTNTKFLFDPSINIRMAWRIFEDSGYSFKLWTCGKVYGI